MSDLRSLPSVEQLLQMEVAKQLAAVYGRPAVLESIRSILARLRAHSGKPLLPDRESILSLVQQQLESLTQPSLVPVINATGVVLHTNLGRAPLSQSATLAIQEAAAAYSTLEYDLEKGVRGTRGKSVEGLLIQLTGAEAALVVNNNAAAVLLALSALAKRRRAIISRTQLVEIGGGFRVPEVMSQSGAKLVEVGATNRVHLADYEAGLEEPAALLLHAHSSNFRIIGFTSEPGLHELAALGHRSGVIVMDDLGSGALLDTAKYGLAHEPTVQESLEAGVDLVCFSGDKLLGGPQAGILLGRADLIAKIRKHPLARAVRADKLSLAGLFATLLHYLKDEAEREIPVWRMISAPSDQLRARADSWCTVLGQGEVISGRSMVGGGSLPEESLPTFLLALPVPQPNRFLTMLRSQPVPIIARLDEDRVVFDPRTVFPEQEDLLLASLKGLLVPLNKSIGNKGP